MSTTYMVTWTALRVFALPIGTAKPARLFSSFNHLIYPDCSDKTWTDVKGPSGQLRGQFPNFPLQESSGASCHLYKSEQKRNVWLLKQYFSPYVVISYYLYQSHSIYTILSLHFVLKFFFYLLNKHYIIMYDASPKKNN